MPNPLTDELTPQAKAELAAKFAEMRRHYQPQRNMSIKVVMHDGRRMR